MNGKVGGGGSHARKGNNGISAIPAGSRKIVQSLKEIVNCPETEIYSMLKECNMDPNEAINRLLAQDPFHEVKSKREKKKENKDVSDAWGHSASNSARTSRSAVDRYGGRTASTQYSSSESGRLHGKLVNEKENGAHSYTGYTSSTSGVAENTMQQQPLSHSDSVIIEHQMPSAGSGSGIFPSTQASSGYKSAWMGVPGQVSMADIVKMGRPQAKASDLTNPPQRSDNYHNSFGAASYQDLSSSQGRTFKVSEMKFEPRNETSQHSAPDEDWPVIEPHPTPILSSMIGAPSEPDRYVDPSSNTDHHIGSQLDDYEESENDEVEGLSAHSVGPASVSNRNMPENSGGASHFDNEIYRNTTSYAFESSEAEDGVSSVTANLQQLSLRKDEGEEPHEENRPSVIIPNHLQVHTPECSHLSFGSFGAAIGNTYSGAFASRPSEEISTSGDAPSVTHADTRNNEYNGDEHLRASLETDLAHRTGPSGGNYDAPSASEEEVLKQETLEAAQANHYNFASAVPGYPFENSQQLNTVFAHSHTSSHVQNLPPFSSVTQAYTNLSPSTLSSAVQSVTESDLPYSPFPMAQSMSTKYGTATSINSSTIPVPESLRNGGSLSATQAIPQNLPGSNVAPGPGLPQHLAVHPYSQNPLPLGNYANMIGYPFLHQSYTYLPSAFQQAFAGNSTYHQSLAAGHPQYRNNLSVSSVSQSAGVASGYGFDSSTNIPGNYPLNLPTAPASITMGYEDVTSSQYKDTNHLISLQQQQQNDNSGMWIPGLSSRTVSAVPANTYYSFQGQGQQPTGFRQGQQQQASQQYGGALGYPNFYHSQTGMSLEHLQQQQQQNPRDGLLNSAQGQPSKQSQQLWQNSY